MIAEKTCVLDVEDLVIIYGNGKKSKKAVDDISFQVDRGECVGFIGPNGAGKSSTIKAIMGFLFPASGQVKVFDKPAGSVESRKRIGYLPEVALYYPFMKGRELLELYGGLHRIPRKELKSRVPVLLEQVGLDEKGETLIKHYSKGMQQRLGIAQAIIAAPEFLVFDELSSGLDPLGRYDLREVLHDLKKKGTTIFFSSHELTEVETLCDRAILINDGKIVCEGQVSDLMKPLDRYEIEFSLSNGTDLASLIPADAKVHGNGSRKRVELRSHETYSRLLTYFVSAGATIHHSEARRISLEDFFINLVRPSGVNKG
jgi:ABC-2 type transport system ATP-binding protein